MTITSRSKSTEPCAEAGWTAFHYHVDGEIDEAFILSLRPLGSFLYMKSLARPFFKVESDNYIIKGLLHDDHFLMAAHRDNLSELDKIEAYIRGMASADEAEESAVTVGE